jgi:hypothetical protein
MGLTKATLEEVCRRGLAEYLLATPYHPSNAAGTFLYHEAVRAMRELLVPTGWEFAEESLAFTFNSDLAIALAVSSGSVYAGDPTQNPSFKYPKGPTTLAAVAGNARQLGLFDGVPGFTEYATRLASKRVAFDTFQIWWLIHHVDLRKGVMRAELSLPVRIGSGAETNQWESRIILDPIPFEDAPDADRTGDPVDGPDFDVEVRKKA